MVFFVNYLSKIANKNWGADQKTLLRLHQMIVLGPLEYGCNVYEDWNPSITKDCELQLERSALIKQKTCCAKRECRTWIIEE
jgi:hypothetical protein